MIKCLASGSSGNGWVFDDGEQILVVECGVPVMEMKIRINFQISRVVGCIVTHSHVDHSKYISQYEGCGLKVFKPYEQEEDFQLLRIGNYTIRTFPLVHSVRCLGFLIDNPTLGRTLFATDTEYIKYRFKRLNTVIIEANYVTDMIDDELEGEIKTTHVLRGHMEISTTEKFLQINNNKDLDVVILAHLSDVNANAQMFRERIAAGENGYMVYIARKGLTIQ